MVGQACRVSICTLSCAARQMRLVLNFERLTLWLHGQHVWRMWGLLIAASLCYVAVHSVVIPCSPSRVAPARPFIVMGLVFDIPEPSTTTGCVKCVLCRIKTCTARGGPVDRHILVCGHHDFIAQL
jgi:hypothetical protein